MVIDPTPDLLIELLDINQRFSKLNRVSIVMNSDRALETKQDQLVKKVFPLKLSEVLDGTIVFKAFFRVMNYLF